MTREQVLLGLAGSLVRLVVAGCCMSGSVAVADGQVAAGRGWEGEEFADIIHFIGTGRPYSAKKVVAATDGGSALRGLMHQTKLTVGRACVSDSSPSTRADAGAMWALICPSLAQPIAVGDALRSTCTLDQAGVALQSIVMAADGVEDCSLTPHARAVLWAISENYQPDAWPVEHNFREELPRAVDPRPLIGASYDALLKLNMGQEKKELVHLHLAQAALAVAAASEAHQQVAELPDEVTAAVKAETESRTESKAGSYWWSVRAQSCQQMRESLGEAAKAGAPAEVSALIILLAQATYTGDQLPTCWVDRDEFDRAVGALGSERIGRLPPLTRALVTHGATSGVMARRRALGDAVSDAELTAILGLARTVETLSRAWLEWSTDASASPSAYPPVSGELVNATATLLVKALDSRPDVYHARVEELLPSLIATLVQMEAWERLGAVQAAGGSAPNGSVGSPASGGGGSTGSESGRSIPRYSVLQPLLTVEKFSGWCVQYTATEAEVAEFLELAVASPRALSTPREWCGTTQADAGKVLVPRSWMWLFRLPQLMGEVSAEVDKLGGEVKRRDMSPEAARFRGVNTYTKLLEQQARRWYRGRHRDVALDLVLEADRVSSAQRLHHLRGGDASLYTDVGGVARGLQRILRGLGLPEFADLVTPRRTCEERPAPLPKARSRSCLLKVSHRSVLFPLSAAAPVAADFAVRFVGRLSELIANDILSRTSGLWAHDQCSPWVRNVDGREGLVVYLPEGGNWGRSDGRGGPADVVRIVQPGSVLVFGDPARNGTAE